MKNTYSGVVLKFPATTAKPIFKKCQLFLECFRVHPLEDNIETTKIRTPKLKIFCNEVKNLFLCYPILKKVFLNSNHRSVSFYEKSTHPIIRLITLVFGSPYSQHYTKPDIVTVLRIPAPPSGGKIGESHFCYEFAC